MLSTFRPLRGVSSLFSRLRLCAQARTDTAQRYDACDRAIIYRINDDPTGAAWIYTAVDFDGTASLTGVTSIVGSHLAWWRYSPTCQKYADWTCGCVRVLTARGITGADHAQLHAHRCRVRSTGVTPPRWVPFAAAGPCQHAPAATEEPHRARRQHGTLADATLCWVVIVDVVQLPRGQLVVLVIPYPAGTAFSIPVTQKWYGPQVFPVSAASVDAVLSM